MHVYSSLRARGLRPLANDAMGIITQSGVSVFVLHVRLSFPALVMPVGHLNKGTPHPWINLPIPLILIQKEGVLRLLFRVTFGLLR